MGMENMEHSAGMRYPATWQQVNQDTKAWRP